MQAEVVPTQVTETNRVTPESIHQNFANRIESNFLLGDSNKIIGNLSNQELADLAALYSKANRDDSSPLLRIVAMKADAAALRKISGTFGEYKTALAVNSYAPDFVKQQYAQMETPQFTNVSQSAYIAMHNGFARGGASAGFSVATGGPAPTIDNTLYEIYLDYRTAPIGSLSVRSALVETSIFAGKRLAPAFTTGYAIGTGLNILINTYEPSLGDTIGGTLNGMVIALASAVDLMVQGKIMDSINTLFGAPVPLTSNGDNNIYAPMVLYINDGGRTWCGQSRCPPIVSH